MPDHTEKTVTNKLNEWLKHPLKPWNISRDNPYFGFPIPGVKGKYFYVWMDAPLGYLSTTKEWCLQTKNSFEDYWAKDAKTEIVHFLGKDIVYFHALFFPVMLKTAGYKTPDKLFVHGFLTLNGKKMSKSKGTLILVRDYLKRFDAGSLRYYYASKVGAGIEDVDLNLDDFVNRVNSDLVGKITNLASRSVKLLHQHFSGNITSFSPEGKALWKRSISISDEVSRLYEAREFPKAQVLLRSLAETTNRYFDAKEPWKSVHTDPILTHQVLSDALRVFRVIAICLKPILPSYAKKVEVLFQEESFTWDSISTPIIGKKIMPYEPLATRLDSQQTRALIQDP